MYVVLLQDIEQTDSSSMDPEVWFMVIIGGFLKLNWISFYMQTILSTTGLF